MNEDNTVGDVYSSALTYYTILDIQYRTIPVALYHKEDASAVEYQWLCSLCEQLANTVYQAGGEKITDVHHLGSVNIFVQDKEGNHLLRATVRITDRVPTGAHPMEFNPNDSTKNAAETLAKKLLDVEIAINSLKTFES